MCQECLTVFDGKPDVCSDKKSGNDGNQPIGCYECSVESGNEHWKPTVNIVDQKKNCLLCTKSTDGSENWSWQSSIEHPNCFECDGNGGQRSLCDACKKCDYPNDGFPFVEDPPEQDASQEKTCVPNYPENCYECKDVNGQKELTLKALNPSNFPTEQYPLPADCTKCTCPESNPNCSDVEKWVAPKAVSSKCQKCGDDGEVVGGADPKKCQECRKKGDTNEY